RGRRGTGASGSERSTSASPPVFRYGTASEVAKRILTGSVVSRRKRSVARHVLLQDQLGAGTELRSDRVVQYDDPIVPARGARLPPVSRFLRGIDAEVIEAAQEELVASLVRIDRGEVQPILELHGDGDGPGHGSSARWKGRPAAEGASSGPAARGITRGAHARGSRRGIRRGRRGAAP